MPLKELLGRTGGRGNGGWCVHDPTEHPQYNAMHDVTFEVGRHFVSSSQADWKLGWNRKISVRWPDVGELAVKDDVTRAVS